MPDMSVGTKAAHHTYKLAIVKKEKGDEKNYLDKGRKIS